MNAERAKTNPARSSRPWRSTALAAVAAVILGAALVRAQPALSPIPEPGRMELGIGAIWIGRASLGSRDANETTGTGGTFRLFASSTELASASGVEGRVAVRVMRRLDAEVFASYTTPQLQAHIDSDAESSSAPLTIAGTIQQFAIGGAALWYPRVPRLGGRARLFVRGGAGYLRQLENDGTLIVTGRTYEAGAGLTFMVVSRARGLWKGIGARADARAVVRQKGVAFDDRAHVSPAAGASLFVRF